MLQNIRENIQGTVAKVIIGIIIVPFAIFGVETLISSASDTPPAKVNGEKISQVDLLQAIQLQKRQLLAMMGNNVQPEMLDDAKLRGPALESLITQQLLQQSADNLKLRVSTQSIDEMILAVPQFQESGKFSAERYKKLLSEQGFTPSYYKQLLRREMVADQLHSGIADSEFATAREINVVTGLLQQQRSFVFAVLPVAALEQQVTVADADIDAYYKAHGDQYMRDERVKLDYIELRAQDFAKPVDDATVRAEYDKFASAFKPVTERHAAHILIEINAQRSDADAQARAQEVEKKLAGGASFEQVAGEYSDDLSSKGNAGDLGTSRGDLFPPVFENALAKLKVGEVSGPVKSDAGYHIIKLLDEQTDTLPTFEAKRDEITRQLSMGNAQPELQKAVEKLRDLVFNSDGLGGPAKDVNQTVKQSDWIDRKSTDALFGDAKVQAAAFGKEVLQDGNNSDVIELAPDHYVVLRAASHEVAMPKTLEEVKPQVEAAVKREQAIVAARKRADELSTQVKAGGDLLKLAQQAGYKAEFASNTTRNGAANPEIARAAFGMVQPASGQSSLETVTLGSGDVALIQLQSVAAGNADSLNATQKAGLAMQLEQANSRAAFGALMDSLRKAAKIERQ